MRLYYDFDIARRIDLAGDITTSSFSKQRTSMGDRIDFMNMARNYCRASPFDAPATSSRDIDELHRCRQYFLGVHDVSELAEPRVRDRNHADVRVNHRAQNG